MSDATVKCPKCGTLIPITEALAGPLLEATRSEMQTRIDVAILQATEATQKAAAKAASIEEEIVSRMKVQRAQADMLAKQEAREQIDDAKTVAVTAQREAEALRAKLAVAQQAQAEALRKERELEGRERELDITIEQRISAESAAIRRQAKQESDTDNSLRLLEKDELLRSMQAKIEELKQKAEQGSQQMQGEVQEEDLKMRLRAAFPRDTVEDVGKGVQGADLVQRVEGDVGIILLESKRTKNFSVGWLGKLREDGRAARSDVLVLASQALPDGIEGFGCQEGVWICAPRYVIPLVAVLRETLLSVARERRSAEGQETRAVVVYKYVVGSQFRRRIEAIVESFATMKADLDSERRAFAKVWAKRETQLERALLGAAGLVGDVQALSEPGAMVEIEGLSLHALVSGNEV
jgi:hypothetical protein